MPSTLLILPVPQHMVLKGHFELLTLSLGGVHIVFINPASPLYMYILLCASYDINKKIHQQLVNKISFHNS